MTISKDDITKRTVELALNRARELGIKKIVVASYTGKTAEMLVGCGLEVVCVTHQVGFSIPNEDEMAQEMRAKLSSEGVKVLTGTHLMGGINRALRNQFGGVYPSEIVATALRMFGQGLKVCIEISVMAADAGLAKAGEDLIALGGSDTGADTAAVICPAHSQDFFKTKIREVICKPFNFK
ncbi:MAG: hypothetical protein M1308_02255 [Actinobacteria bacterium]|nr:hypothetical protein [Actinomycetota bacterium]